MAQRKRRRSAPRPSNRPPGLLRTIAEATGRSESHISRVVSGERVSATLTAEIEAATGLAMAEIRKRFADERTRLAAKYLSQAAGTPAGDA